MRREEGKAGSGLPGRPDLSRPPARGDFALLREGLEPDAGGGDHRAQDVADAETVHPSESGGSGGDAEVMIEKTPRYFLSTL